MPLPPTRSPPGAAVAALRARAAAGGGLATERPPVGVRRGGVPPTGPPARPLRRPWLPAAPRPPARVRRRPAGRRGRRLGVGRGRGRADAVAAPLPPRLAPPAAPQGLPAPPGHASPDFGFHEPSGAASPFGPPPPHHLPAYPVAPAAAYHRHAAAYPLGTPSHGTPSQEWTPSQEYRGRPHRRHGRGCASPPSTSPARLPPGGALHDQ